MKITNPSRAGSMESNDIYIMLHPCDEGLQVQLESKVIKQFGSRIRQVIYSTLENSGVTHALVIAKDSGALDYTIKSRIMTAVNRSLEGGTSECK